MFDNSLANETLLLGLLLTVFGAAGSLLLRNAAVRRSAELVLFHGLALASLAASASWSNSSGDILAATVLILGTLWSLIDGKIQNSAEPQNLNPHQDAKRVVP